MRACRDERKRNANNGRFYLKHLYKITYGVHSARLAYSLRPTGNEKCVTRDQLLLAIMNIGPATGSIQGASLSLSVAYSLKDACRVWDGGFVLCHASRRIHQIIQRSSISTCPACARSARNCHTRQDLTLPQAGKSQAPSQSVDLSPTPDFHILRDVLFSHYETPPSPPPKARQPWVSANRRCCLMPELKTTRSFLAGLDPVPRLARYFRGRV